MAVVSLFLESAGRRLAGELLLEALLLLACVGVSAAPLPSIAESVELSSEYRSGDRFMGIRLLGSVQLARDAGDGDRVGGLSGLAWDDDAGLLYAVTDLGRLYHLEPVFGGGRLVDVRLRSVFPLRGASGRPLRGSWADAEGMVLERAQDGSPRLLISFERRPRIVRYRPDGRFDGVEVLPSALEDVSAYEGPNQGLEALASLPGIGLLTVSERPMAGDPDGAVTIHALDGRRWKLPLSDEPAASVTAVEAVGGDELLILERSFVSLMVPLVIRLRTTRLPPQTGSESLAVTEAAVFDNGDGWFMDNFEGLAHHRGRRFFMVSDDNASWLQRTLLTYFELIEPD